MSYSKTGLVPGFGNAVRQARCKAGLTLRAFADKMGVSSPYISDIEHGRRCIENLDKIAEALKISKHDLLKESERLHKEEIQWLESRPDIMKLLRKRRRREE